MELATSDAWEAAQRAGGLLLFARELCVTGNAVETAIEFLFMRTLLAVASAIWADSKVPDSSAIELRGIGNPGVTQIYESFPAGGVGPPLRPIYRSKCRSAGR
jgi:hypothetical protein